MIRSLIIEDEKNSRDTLRNYLTDYCPDIEIIGEALDVQDGIEQITALKPQLVFLDISLPSGTGFDILDRVSQHYFELIFVTAYDNYALEAIKNSNCTDYIVKPISVEDLQNAIKKVKNNLDKENELSILQRLDKQTHKLTIPTNERYEIVEIGNIVYCEADHAYTIIYLEDNTKIVCSKNLMTFERILIKYNFFRTHRTYLINLAHLIAYIRGRGGIAVMSNNDELPISEIHRIGFLDKLNIVR